MYRILFFCLLCLCCRPVCGQSAAKSLSYYIGMAKAHSPLLNDYRNQAAMQQDELARLKALYTHARLELDGECLFVPVVSVDGGRTAFKWNAQSGTDYYGYDLGESSGHLHAGLTWTHPLLGRGSYRVAQEQATLQADRMSDHLRLESHRLERSVTEQYLLCRLDLMQLAYADSVAALLEAQCEVVRKLARNGFSAHGDVFLVRAEQALNEENRAAARQSFRAHLADLNVLCGIGDTACVELAAVSLRPARPLLAQVSERFTEQFRLDSLQAAAALRNFNLQYKPRLDLFVNAGLQTGVYDRLYRHLGWSAGLTFSWTLADGGQRKHKERQTQRQWNTIRAYRDRAEQERGLRVEQCRTELRGYDERCAALRRQLEAYGQVLAGYERELRAGQLSVLDFLTLLRRKTEAQRELALTQTNRQLAVAALNYWNW